ncbi:MAG TPA: TadE family protein [Myxococcus sp.]|nr:TadE family protein [Myxococcus sp.]
MSAPAPSLPSRAQSGQAAVEAALTLPLVVFLFLGTLQLFLLMQGRILAQYALSRAARAGSLNHGSCRSMQHAAIAALLPSFHSFLAPTYLGGGSNARKYVEAFRERSNNRFRPTLDNGHDGSIIWLYRERPLQGVVFSGWWEEDYDLPSSARAPSTSAPLMLELRMIYWFPLRIPFANWVWNRMVAAHFGLASYRYSNPLMLAERDANWDAAAARARLDAPVAEELMRLANATPRPQYSLPIEVTYVTRMMTPPRAAEFQQQDCPR